MVYFEINKKNYNKGTPNKIDQINDKLANKDNKTFLLIYMEGCGPCNATRPEWSKINNVLSNDFLNKDNIAIVSIDKDLFGKLKNAGSEPSGFPTIRFITSSGENIETYEDSDVPETKDRSIDSFVEWIKSKSGDSEITSSERKIAGGTITRTRKRTRRNRKTKTKKRYGGKWSLKYKNSINCRKPKGFSQKQHCKYGRKK